MGLKAIIDSTDGLDDAFKDFYKPSGDKFILDISDFDNHPAISGLSKTMKEERDARKLSEKALKDLKGLTEGLDLEKLKGIDPETYKATVSDLEKYKADEIKRNKQKLKDKEEWEKLEKQLQGEHTAAIDGLTSKHQQELDIFKTKIEELNTTKEETVGSMRLTLEKYLKDKEIVSALAEAKGNIPILMPHVSKYVKVLKDEANGYAAKIVDDKGTVRINDKGSSMTISEFIAELREKKEFQGDGIFAKEKHAGGSGSEGNQDDDHGNEKNPFSKDHFNLTEQGKLLKKNPAEYARLKKAAGKG